MKVEREKRDVMRKRLREIETDTRRENDDPLLKTQNNLDNVKYGTIATGYRQSSFVFMVLHFPQAKILQVCG